jgi:hypothetical protein
MYQVYQLGGNANVIFYLLSLGPKKKGEVLQLVFHQWTWFSYRKVWSG